MSDFNLGGAVRSTFEGQGRSILPAKWARVDLFEAGSGHHRSFGRRDQDWGEEVPLSDLVVDEAVENRGRSRGEWVASRIRPI